MLKSLAKIPEWRILAYLGIITLSWHLVTVLGSFFSFFADIFLILLLSWILASIVEPVVNFLSSRNIPKSLAAVIAYLCLAGASIFLFFSILPATVSQLSQLTLILPGYLPQNPFWSTNLENFITSTLTNSVTLASELAGFATALILIYILSFYFLLSRKEISRLLVRLIPNDYRDDFRLLETTLNTTFATFLRVQVLLGLVIGLVTFLVLRVLHIDYAISTAVVAALLATIPVIGNIIFIIPPILASLVSSPQKLLIVVSILILASQLIYNVWAPRLLGKALRIHPIIVLLSFLLGYKTAGIWGALFAVPVASALAVVFRDFLLHWRRQADEP